MPTKDSIFYYASKNGTATKPPVVLIHGAGGDHSHWPHTIRRLPGYRIFALDLPAHGKSDGLGQQTISAYAWQVLDWMLDIGIPHAVFVGHSMGGAIAQTLALDHSEHVLGLGLFGTGARLRVAPELLDKLSRENTYEAAMDMIVSGYFSGELGLTIPVNVRGKLGKTRPSVVHGDYVACNEFDRMKEIQNIKVPTLVMCGENDPMTPPKYSQYLADNIPNASFELIPKSAHLAMLEQPDLVAKTLETFLDSIPY